MGATTLETSGWLTGVARAEGGPAWLRESRQKAFDAYLAHGAPTTKREEWKYTSLREVLEANWTAGEPGPAVFERDLPAFSEGSVRVVLVNGRFDRNLSGGAEPAGLQVASLRDALSEGWVEARLGRAEPDTTRTVDRELRPDFHVFGSLNTATFEDGVAIRVAAGTVVEPIVEIVHISTGAGQMFSPRLLIEVEAGASVRFVETYVTDGTGATLTLPVTEVFVASGANVEHVRFQDEGDEATHIGLWQTRQEAESEYRSYNVCFGSRLARVDQGVWLGGERTVTRLDGVVCANGRQHIDNHTRLDHAMPHGESFEIYKQIVDDEATVVFNGKIFVHQDAQKTDAKQTNQALLLSPKATIDSKPQLEIFADDVKCTHGATVGQLEDLPLFYMRQRGVPKSEAEAVLVYAFAAEVLELVSIDDVRLALERRLYEKLGVDLG